MGEPESVDMTFNVGDRVRVTDDSSVQGCSTATIGVGSEGDIINIHGRTQGSIEVSFSEHEAWHFGPTQLELVK